METVMEQGGGSWQWHVGQGLWRGPRRLCSTASRGRGHWDSTVPCSRSLSHSFMCHHHVGMHKYQPLLLPLLHWWGGWPAPAMWGATGSEALRPIQVECSVTNYTQCSSCFYPAQTFWVILSPKQGFLLCHLVTGCKALCSS